MGTPIIAQLNHCCGQSKEESAHMTVVAPSKISDYKAKEMTKTEILEIIEAFVQGIKNGMTVEESVKIAKLLEQVDVTELNVQTQLKGMKVKNIFTCSETHDELTAEQGHIEIYNDYFNRYYKSNKK